MTLRDTNPFKRMVGTAGIEPATPAMSTQCSPAELRAHFNTTKK